MSSVRSLRIQLGHTDVGSLFGLDDGRVYFRFDESYAINPTRPVLSTAFIADTEPDTQAQLLSPGLASTIGEGNGRLPVFFRNLLPEGMLRKHLLSSGRLEEGDELGLLAYCGEDLPGDAWAVAETLDEPALGRLLTQGRDSYEMSSHQLPTPQAVSLSGVQPKVSLMEEPGGRYVMRSKNNAGLHFIGKLPASDYAAMPEVEYVSMQLAAAAGVTTCQTDLLPLTAIAGQLPYTLREDARNFLLVRRFDRDADTATGRLHMEDFAQALELRPEAKYEGSYAAIGLVLQRASSAPEEDLFELLRRIKVNELLGNFDAHVKNFSLLYGAAGDVRLSPAYDIVAYAAYLDGQGHALKFYPDQKARADLTPAVLRQLANTWEVPETRLKDAVAQTVDRAMRTWPALIKESILLAGQKDRLLGHLEKNPGVVAWRKRNKT
ncbi:MAG: type II toxin-antitoxin system HipA family toxin [Pseudomonadota bacterium]